MRKELLFAACVAFTGMDASASNGHCSDPFKGQITRMQGTALWFEKNHLDQEFGKTWYAEVEIHPPVSTPHTGKNPTINMKISLTHEATRDLRTWQFQRRTWWGQVQVRPSNTDSRVCEIKWGKFTALGGQFENQDFSARALIKRSYRPPRPELGITDGLPKPIRKQHRTRLMRNKLTLRLSHPDAKRDLEVYVAKRPVTQHIFYMQWAPHMKDRAFYQPLEVRYPL